MPATRPAALILLKSRQAGDCPHRPRRRADARSHGDQFDLFDPHQYWDTVGPPSSIANPDAKMGQQIFRCPNRGKEFATGFEGSSADVMRFPPSATIRLRCQICADTHEFKFADARVDENVNQDQVSRR
jgi:hypothetical protein